MHVDKRMLEVESPSLISYFVQATFWIRSVPSLSLHVLLSVSYERLVRCEAGRDLANVGRGKRVS